MSVGSLALGSLLAAENAKAGAPYVQQLTADGGTAPYTWTIVEGALPEGIGLDAATGRYIDLLGAGIVVTLTPMILGTLLGHRGLHMNPVGIFGAAPSKARRATRFRSRAASSSPIRSPIPCIDRTRSTTRRDAPVPAPR